MQRCKGQTCVSKPGGFFCLSVIRFEMCLETVCSRSDVETGAGPSQRAVVHVARRTLRSAIASWRPTHQARLSPGLVSVKRASAKPTLGRACCGGACEMRRSWRRVRDEVVAAARPRWRL